MRHRVAGRKFDRPTGQRLALFRSLVRELLIHERIQTTVPRAKEIRPMAEKMITLGKEGSLASRRRALMFVTDKDVVSKLFSDIGPRYATRPGGYTRIVRVGKRLGDGADMAIIELV
jgi:large subunit ribosomal protein L17